jgi:hypothetical protein
VTQGLFRVLDSPHDDAWLFVPVPTPPGADTDAGAADPASEAADPAVEERDDPDPDPDGHTPGVPAVGESDDDTASRAPGVPAVGDAGPSGTDAAPGVGPATGDGTGDQRPDAFEPVRVPRRGHGDLDEAVAALRAGYLVRARLSWAAQEPRVESLSVVKRTLLAFADGVTNLFEAARTAWTTASARGEPMASQVTRGTDGQVNGVLYVFADADGGDRLAEFRSGRRPLEPLIARVNAAAPGGDDAWRGEDGPSVSVGPGGVTVDGGTDEPAPDHGLGRDREVFVLRPADGPFVVVLIATEKGGQLADTVRETYHCPRPEE